jgi:hypothetical protein
VSEFTRISIVSLDALLAVIEQIKTKSVYIEEIEEKVTVIVDVFVTVVVAIG